MDKVIIGLGHKKGTGKDTVANYLVEHWGFTRVAFADVLKQAAGIVYSLTEQQLNGSLKEVLDPRWNRTPRELLQQTGVALRDAVDTDLWVKAAFAKIESSPGNFVISDLRFPNEFRAIQAAGGINCLVNRLIPPNEFSSHQSETALDQADWHFVFDNNSTLTNLFQQVDSFVIKKLMGRSI
jgi:hypothetical protein